METPPPLTTPEAPATSTKSSSVASRLFNVFAAPGDVFDEVKKSPQTVSNWLVPGLILIFVSWIGTWLVVSQDAFQQQYREISEKAIDQQIEKMHMSKEEAEHARQAIAQYGGIGARIGMVVLPVWLGLVVPFIWGAIIWLVGAKILKGGFDYMKAVEVVGLATMIAALGSVIKTLLIFLTGSIMATPGPSLFLKNLDPQNNTVHALLSMINVITLWVLAVRAVGLARLSNVSFAKAAASVFGIWIGYTGLLFGFGQAARLLVRK